jgi:hypothetical protein
MEILIQDISYACEIEQENGRDTEGFNVTALINGIEFHSDTHLTQRQIMTAFKLTEEQYLTIRLASLA